MAVQRNWNYFQYHSDDGTTYALRADQDWGNDAASGGALAAGQPAYGRATRRRTPRRLIFRDPTTFRTFSGPAFTAAAYAAATVGTTTHSVSVPGNVAAIVYTLVKKEPERIPSTVVGRQDPDHA